MPSLPPKPTAAADRYGDGPRFTAPPKPTAASPRVAVGYLAAACLLLLTFVCLPAPAFAGQGDRHRPAPAAADADSPFAPFAPAAEPVAGAVYQLQAQGRPIALATVVGPGRVVTKASELPSDGPAVLLTRHGRPIPTQPLGVDTATDLALLSVGLGDAPAVDFAAEAQALGEGPAIGRWVVTAGPQRIPLGVGIVSVQPRPIAPRRVLLGVEIRPHKQGPRVHRVLPDMGAARAGIKPGDIITHVNDNPTSTRADVLRFLKDQAEGDRVTVKVIRGEREMSFAIGVQPLPDTFDTRGARMNRMGGELSTRSHGFERVIQHDAVLAPHQVGGPALDLDGRVLGLNIARAGRIASYVLPSDLVAEAIGRIDAQAEGPKTD